jgi:organic hydroperoxide reductase OsmC/OhrA
MSIVKLHRYGVRTHRTDPRRVDLEAPGKPVIHVATPPEFRNGTPGVWSPEELLVGSLAACFELTVVAIAEYKNVPLHGIQVGATGDVERKDGAYRFMLIELDVLLETDAGREYELEHLAEVAKERCLVSDVLDVPIRLSVETRVAETARERAV